MDVNFATKCQSLACVWQREGVVIDRGAIDVIYKASWLVTSVKGLFGLPLLQIGVYWEVKLPMHVGHVALIVYYFMHVLARVVAIFYPIVSGG